MGKRLSIVVPCYNEEEALPVTAERLETKVSDLRKCNRFDRITDHKVYFVDNGSRGRTWDVIQELNQKNNLFCSIKLSGKEYLHMSIGVCENILERYIWKPKGDLDTSLRQY